MIRLQRLSLPPATWSYLDAQTRRLKDAPRTSRTTLSTQLWRQKSAARFSEVRQVLADMCSGIERCMYCEDSAATDIDHFQPRRLDPLLSFVWTNYLAACSWCNSNLKRDEFPQDPNGAVLLINPVEED